ncbi:hypothetical protein [Piscinibacter koreensis]|uniref:Uncharacterized protein n=1 Tax=Piscinibacter koreensis TaxID=2742824 RepID=A0A7Y6NTR2_9BURK|nr:hypothetical protein [Schlegelella koreensis]NUZ09118.1 hypothetical protein [Schlegelella koreensis]
MEDEHAGLLEPIIGSRPRNRGMKGPFTALRGPGAKSLGGSAPRFGHDSGVGIAALRFRNDHPS